MKWKMYLIVYSILLLSIFAGAYLKLIPTGIKIIPFYDSLGHFVLYGIWGYLLAKVFNRQLMISSVGIPIGIGVALSTSIIEEVLQSLSSIRTFSLSDLGWGLMGIVISWLIVKK